MLHIAVFGDTHGHLRLLWKLCSRWQVEHGTRLDLILQCGDFGYFPDPDALDKATRRYALRDPEELGFARFFLPPDPLEGEDPRIRQILTGDPDDLATVSAHLFWCTGNHEDFQALSQAVGDSNLLPIDVYRRCHLLRSGTVADLDGLLIGAVGGGPENEGRGGDYDDRWSRVSDAACTDLLGHDRLDILLTHAGPQVERILPFGSAALRALVDLAQPRFHFFAHHRRVEPVTLGDTRSFHLNDVSFERVATGPHPFAGLHEGCMGILRWTSAEEHDFTVVDEPWMADFTWTDFPGL